MAQPTHPTNTNPNTADSAVNQDHLNDWIQRFNDDTKNVSTKIKSKSGGDARPWASSLFGCFAPIDLCLITCCLPCVTFGKTHHRTRTNRPMTEYSPVNASCLLLCGSACFGLSFIPMWQQRADVRQRYNLQGDCLTDLLLTCCCACCSLIQQEKESELLEARRGADAGYGTRVEEQMSYAPEKTEGPNVVHG